MMHVAVLAVVATLLGVGSIFAEWDTFERWYQIAQEVLPFLMVVEVCAGAGSFMLPAPTEKLLNPEVFSDTRVSVWRTTWLSSAGVCWR